MIVDIHTHIFPDDIRNYRENYFTDETAFKLLYESPQSKMVGYHETLEAMDEEKVDVSVVFGFPWRNMETVRKNNDYVIEAVTKHPDRLKGFCCLDPALPNAEQEVERCLDAGLAGVGELAFYESGIEEQALDRLEPIMGLCREKGAPVMIHTNEPVGHLYPGKTPNTLAQIYGLVKRFPENRIILAHWGGGLFFYHLLKKEVKSVLANVWFDTAASPYLYSPQIYALAGQMAGFDKILFGSDFPLLRPGRYFKEIDEAEISPEAIGKICGLNAKMLFSL